ncbi:MAG: M36 family metallopeptidase [Actinomycetota bacterium]|nr:M36 family metallopeptidase [Actinomycetota bacterium]
MVGLLVVGLAGVAPPAASSRGAVAPQRDVTFQGEEGMPPDYDRRRGSVPPSAAARAIVRELGGTARWNQFGTPISLIDYFGYLDRGLTGDPGDAARRWVAEHAELFRLTEAGLENLELINVIPLDNGAHVVLFRQTFGGIPAAQDGLITLGIAPGGKLAYVSSSAAGNGNHPGEATLSPAEAFMGAARDVGWRLDAGAIGGVTTDRSWTVLDVRGVTEPGRVRLRALPTPLDGVKLVYETLFVNNDLGHEHPEAWTHFVDARTGDVYWRQSRLQFFSQDNPEWSVFPANPPLDYSSRDSRDLWCWERMKGCKGIVANEAPPGPWDTEARSGQTTFTTWGNSAIAGEAWLSPLTPAEQYRPVSPTRAWSYPWTNQWYESKCDYGSIGSPQRNDIDAAISNLFVMHNRMHDWAYHLGFTERTYNMQIVNHRDENEFEGEEQDPEIGNAQAGALTAGGPSYLGRDNANQITPPDGTPPITNMYLWQPIAGAFYSACVDGDFDMAVIGHEYTHAISNRMVAGPSSGLSGPQAGAMGESWSDLVAVEYMNEYDVVTEGNPFAVGSYVTGDTKSAIRNYGMNYSPLNYSNVGYDITGPQVHADGEIWSAINYDIRRALNFKYDADYPSTDEALQRACADGERPPSRCPGNRRWIQIVFDAFLLMQSQVSMVDSRDAYLGADKMRFKGENQDLLWRVFANTGLGKDVSSNGNSDPDPIPSFAPLRGTSTKVQFRAVGDGVPDPRDVQFFVGDYEARTMPVADIDGATDLGSKVELAPGRYHLIARANGYGAVRFVRQVRKDTDTITVRMKPNLASKSNGAKATGDGVNLNALIDDTEATNWASLTHVGTASGLTDVRGRQVIVNLAGGKRRIGELHVSAMLRPSDSTNTDDPGSQNRFSALRQFAFEVCTTTPKNDCTARNDFRRIYVSRKKAFPAIAPRPKAPHLIMRVFDIPNVTATHVRFVVLHNQCTGTPAFQGEQDNDPLSESHCPTGTSPVQLAQNGHQGNKVRAAELQVFAP